MAKEDEIIANIHPHELFSDLLDGNPLAIEMVAQTFNATKLHKDYQEKNLFKEIYIDLKNSKVKSLDISFELLLNEI